MACKSLKISKVFLRFFLSFFSVLMIPLLVLGGMSRKIIREIMLKYESSRKIAALSQCAQGIDNELSNISTIVFKASVEQDFSPYRMENFVQNSLSTINRLKSYKTANNFIQEIYVFSAYSDYIFSSSTTYTYDRFISQKIPGKLSRADLSDFLRMAAAATGFGYMQSADDDTFFLVYPLPSYELTSYAYMIFEIPKKALLAHFNLILDSSKNNLMVFDDSSLIASFADYPAEEQQQIIREFSALPPGQETGYLDLDAGRTPLFFLADKDSSLRYVLTLSETEAMTEVDQILHLFTFHLILTAIFGTIAIFILTRLNYLPIKKMSNSYQSSYQKLNLELQDSLLATKYYFIKNLVNAHPYTPDELTDMLDRTSMHFHDSNFFVVIFHVHNINNSAVIAGITDYLSSLHTGDITGYAANLYEGNIVGIYSCIHADTNRIKEQFGLLHREVRSVYHIMLTVGIGSIKPALSDVAASFLEASTALDCRFIVGKNKLIAFGDLNLDAHTEIEYPQSCIDRVCLSIKNGEKQLLFETLTALFSKIRSNTYSMYTAKLLCYDITNNIIRTLKEMADSNTGFQIPNLIALTSFETVEDLEQMLCRYCETACEFVNSLKSPSLSDLAIRLISKNYARPDFSVSSISDALRVSISYLSHTFKEQQSITLNDYIKLYKIGLAKKMLTETNDSLEKIIRLIGYYDCSSFIRMFKKIEGITPGEYRKKSLL